MSLFLFVSISHPLNNSSTKTNESYITLCIRCHVSWSVLFSPSVGESLISAALPFRLLTYRTCLSFFKLETFRQLASSGSRLSNKWANAARTKHARTRSVWFRKYFPKKRTRKILESNATNLSVASSTVKENKRNCTRVYRVTGSMLQVVQHEK